jgi:hypothetical protein
MARTDHGGSPRTRAVLAGDFVHELEGLDVDELRRRRDEALAEREFLSFLRRLLQVRQDLLLNERARRATGKDVEPLVDRLTSILSEGPQGRGRGEALRLTLPDEDVAEAERRVNALLPEARLTSLEGLEESELDELLAGLERGQREVSADRSAVIRVHDRLQEELKRRYRADHSQILRPT